MLSESRAEELIRAALAAQADRAPDPSDVLAGLDVGRTARAHRDRRLGVVAAAVLVVLAFTIQAGVLHRGADYALTATTPRAAIGYRATWVPPGWVASGRVLPQGQDIVQAQLWRPAGAVESQATLGLVVSLQPVAEPPHSSSRPVDVHGSRGSLSVGSRGDTIETEVTWSLSTGRYAAIHLQQATDGGADALRMARSVVADPSFTMDVPYTFGFLPWDADPAGMNVSGDSPGDWVARGDFNDKLGYGVTVEWGPGLTQVQPGGAPVIVRGGSGRYQTNGVTCVLVTRQNGWWLQLRTTGWAPKSSLVGILDGMTFYPHADYSWLGR